MAPSQVPGSARRITSPRFGVLSSPSFTFLILLAGTFRLLLILYGVHHDATHALKYTDVDYYVFSDASARLSEPHNLASGSFAQYLARSGWRIGTPYDRATYRYTPLLAVLLLANSLLHPLFGKGLFAGCDLAVGYLLQYILVKQQSLPSGKAKLYISTIWLFNPFIANISTRGSAEAVLGVIVLATLALANGGRWKSAALAFGLAVHFKLYPVVYVTAILAKLHNSEKLLNLKQVQFGLVSFISFMALNVAMYSIWGEPFVEHTYLYHLSRLDHRHNFSHHFYEIYLKISSASQVSLHSLDFSHETFSFLLTKLSQSTFIPQLGLTALIGFTIGQKAPLATTCFIQTMVFTTFNRVCTSQYFMWYLWFLPLVLPGLPMSLAQGITMLVAWIAGQAVWLSVAFRLELFGQPVFRDLWMASIGFFAVNICLILVLLHTCGRETLARAKKQD